MTQTAELAELRRADEPRFGGKSANLGELIAAGIPVPPGFAVAAAEHQSNLEEPLRAEISRRYETLGERPVAVRSSAVGEDSAEASFAGQQQTFLWVRGADRVCEAVRNCWASLQSREAVAYRARAGGPAQAAMGVTVQLMVDAAVSGVMFTCNPVNGDPSTVAVNASWGLGTAIVGGEVTPDEYRISKVTGEVMHRAIGPKLIEYVGTERSDVPADRQGVPCLDDERLGMLLDVARRIERHFGNHQDIEWSFSRDGSLFVLQSRPVTVARKKDARPARSAIELVMGTFGADRR